MLWSLDNLRGYSLRATDDTLGSVADVLFDDQSWTVRWLVVDTAWLFGRRVLLAPAALGHPDAGSQEFPVNMTRESIRNAPDVDVDKPVSRQHEVDLYGYYGYAPYWGAGAWGMATIPPAGLYPPVAPGTHPAPVPGAADPVAGRSSEQGDPHLRSGREVTGYYIKATDDSVGHVEDLLVDEAGWAIRYFVVDTRNWLPGRKVLVSPTWVRDISWTDQTVTLGMTRRQIESSPEYDPRVPVGRDYEEGLYRHYGTVGYWA